MMGMEDRMSVEEGRGSEVVEALKRCIRERRQATRRA